MQYFGHRLVWDLPYQSIDVEMNPQVEVEVLQESNTTNFEFVVDQPILDTENVV